MSQNTRPSFHRCTVQTLSDRTEQGWIAGFDAFEKAVVLIDGETALRTFHQSKIVRIERSGPREVTIIVEHDVRWNTWRVTDDGGLFSEPATFYSGSDASVAADGRSDRYIADDPTVTIKTRNVRIEER